ncbi:niemann-Pick type C-related protein 1 [Sparganum proliferum]
MGRKSQCFQMMRYMYCQLHCDVNQSQFVQILHVNQQKAITALRVQLERDFAQTMFKECSKLKVAWLSIVEVICIKQPCTLKEFFRSLGATEKMGGTSPYLIDFQFID